MYTLYVYIHTHTFVYLNMYICTYPQRFIMPIAAVCMAVANLWAVGGAGVCSGEFRVYTVTKSVFLPQRKEGKKEFRQPINCCHPKPQFSCCNEPYQQGLSCRRVLGI